MLCVEPFGAKVTILGPFEIPPRVFGAKVTVGALDGAAATTAAESLDAIVYRICIGTRTGAVFVAPHPSGYSAGAIVGSEVRHMVI